MRALLLLPLLLSAPPAAATVPSGCQEDYATCKEDCTIEYGGSSRALKKLTRCIADCQETLDVCANRHSSLKDLPPGVAEDSRPARRKTGEPPGTKPKKGKEEDPWAEDAPAPRRERNPDDPFGYDAPANAQGGETRRESYRASESRKEEIPPAPAPTPVTGSRATSSRAQAEETVLGTSSEGTRRSGYRASEAAQGPEVSLGLEDVEPLDKKPAPEPEPVAKPGPKAAPVKPAAEPAKPEPVKEAPAVSARGEEKDPLLDPEPTVLPAPPPTRKPALPAAPPRPAPAPEPKKEDISEWDPNGD